MGDNRGMAHPRLYRPRDFFGKDPARQAELMRLRKSGMSYKDIGRHFDPEHPLDHTTIMHAVRRFAGHLIKPHVKKRAAPSPEQKDRARTRMERLGFIVEGSAIYNDILTSFAEGWGEPVHIIAARLGKANATIQRCLRIAGVYDKMRAEKRMRPVEPEPLPPPKLMKYDHLLHEPLNQGKDYSTICAEARARTKVSPERKAFLKRLAAEHKARVKKRGNISGPLSKQEIKGLFTSGVPFL